MIRNLEVNIMNIIITHSLKQTHDFARRVLSQMEGANILALYGNLGTGKTAFSQGIGKALGISGRMVSPTFVVVRKYALATISSKFSFENLYHIDLYRIEKQEEVNDLGIIDFINNPKNLVVIEWAEKMGNYLPEKRIDLQFEYVNERERKITILDNVIEKR